MAAGSGELTNMDLVTVLDGLPKIDFCLSLLAFGPSLDLAPVLVSAEFDVMKDSNVRASSY